MPMHLKTYLRTLSVQEKAEFAKQVGASLTHIKFVAYGAKRASCELAMVLERESHGQVSVEEIRPDAPWHVIRGKSSKQAAA